MIGSGDAMRYGIFVEFVEPAGTNPQLTFQETYEIIGNTILNVYRNEYRFLNVSTALRLFRNNYMNLSGFPPVEQF